MNNPYDLEGDTVRVSKADRIATITLNRPTQHNALSRELRTQFTRALVGLDADETVNVIIVTGAGEKAFSTGADLKELETAPLTPDEMGQDCAFMQAFSALTKPIIAAVNGLAVTGGFELAAQCDILVASATARFADTHSRVGVVSAWGFTQTLSMLIGPVRARYLSFTGNYLDAQTAKDWGLVLDVLPPDQLMPYCRKLAAEIASCDTTILRAMRECMRVGQYGTREQGLELEARYAKESVARFDAADFGARRAAVMQRGRGQL